MRMLARSAWVVFLFFALLATAFGVFPGLWFEQDGTDRDVKLVTTTYAAVAVVLTVAVTLTAFRHGERWAWLALWIWPAFFLVHGTMLFVVDLVFAALGAALGAAALVATAPSRRAPGGPATS